ncbi:MAG: tRNA pseudouridine(55) synthase TruB [Christensenellaceae bacterium]
MTGFINIDKGSGVSSSFAVQRVKRVTKTPCGHMGTLDPLASGVLPVGVGRASRLFDYFLSKKKTYRASFRFGVSSDTLDSEGTVTEETDVIPSEAEIAAVLTRFLGEIEQVPPNYSAKSVNGRRGYELARAGVAFTLPPKQVTVYDFRLLGESAKNVFDFEIVCGGGTYIRSLARDVGEATGSLAIMCALRRTQSGVFTEETAVPYEILTEENVADYLIPTDSVLPFPVYAPEGETKRKLLNGMQVETDLADGSYKCYAGEAFYGILSAEHGLCRITTKLC